ncbi:ribosome hibernation-promoting factor, HPF/YfiA family [Poriferisphaera sp. WC338]|uniref:ribosome hibernation-promoting factor, HPF/YfiA family n=1 Tax=Poriferisphaera sp. WC338 TaxID=3425129 RepID=UPI003D816B91
MEVIVSGKHLDVTEPIREFAEEKANRLPKFYDRVSTVEVIIDKADSHTFDAEVIAHVDGAEHFVATGKNSDLYHCIDETVHKVERQLHDHKEKLRNHKGH